MIFISLAKFRKKPTKEIVNQASKMFAEAKKKGVKILGWYWTLGRYDAVLVIEAPDEKVAMGLTLKAADMVATETMVALPREEAVKLVES